METETNNEVITNIHEPEIKELKQDAEEARALLATATRKRLRDILSAELLKIESRLKHLETTSSSVSKNDAATESSANTKKTYTTIIRNYSWDQSDKFLKLYIPLPGVEGLEKDNIIGSFGKRSITLQVSMLAGKNHELKILNLAYTIIPDKSYHKVKTDMVIIYAAKEKSCSWEAVTAEEKRIKDAKMANKKEPGKADPSGGLMDLMKQMYDDGDDEMKRMLNKTWYESQQKQGGSGIPDMGDLQL